MATATEKGAPPTPPSLANVFLWQIAGLAIGGLIPTSALALLPDSWVGIMPNGDWSPAVSVAFLLAPSTAVIGGIVGTIIGIYDRRPTLV
jgi:hypothetical protein